MKYDIVPVEVGKMIKARNTQYISFFTLYNKSNG